MSGLQLLFIGSIIVSLLALVALVYVLSARNVGHKKKNKQPEPEQNSYTSTSHKANQAYKPNEHTSTPDNLKNVERETAKVFKLVGVAKHFSSMSVVDDILNGELENATLKIAQKLSIQNPVIKIKKEINSKTTEDGRQVIADVQISNKNEAIFGTSDFNYQMINITVYPGFNTHPEKFVYVLAHELCHKILHSLDRNRSNDNQDERDTDIAASLLGFSKSYKIAKQIEPGLGYLREDESVYLVDKCDSLLKEIHDKREQFYKNYVILRQRNDEKIIFLNNLYRAKKLWNKNGWDIDYSLVADDYNSLITCTHLLSVQELSRYWDLCCYFKAMNGEQNRYSSDTLEAEKYLNELTSIINGFDLPSNDLISALKKYQ